MSSNGPDPKDLNLGLERGHQIRIISPVLTEGRLNCGCHRNRLLQQSPRERMRSRMLMIMAGLELCARG